MKACSVVDYAITSESLRSSVNYLIDKTPSYFSDHTQIVTHLNVMENYRPNFGH